MNDHETARRAFATSLDFPIEPAEREALDAHLHACASCRAFTAAMRSDAAVLGEVDLGPVPVAVRADVAIAAERPGRGGSVGRWVVIAAVGALLLAALGGGALGIGGSGGRGGSGEPGATAAGAMGQPQIAWRTDVVTLSAADFSIVASGKTFRGTSAPVDVRSDPGDATYRTLEATWREHGVEMRLSLYFGGDATTWWVDEIRIYNGTTNPDWLYARGTFFKTALGATWTGDQDITMTDPEGVGGLPATVRFRGLALASRAFDGVNEPIGGGITLPADARPFGPGGILHCSGILQMTPKQAEATLLGLGYRLSWRLERTTGPNTGYADIVKNAPDGVIFQEPAPGSQGELIVFVAPFGDPMARPLPLPGDCPVSGPGAPPPTPTP